MKNNFDSLLLTTILLVLYSFNTIGQKAQFEWDDTDRGKLPNFEKSFFVSNNQVIFIEKTTTKPAGLKPYLYTYDDENNSLSVKHIEGLKHMEVFREFFNSVFFFETINDVTYRIDVEYEKRKFHNDTYSVSMQQIDLNNLSRLGEKITLLKSESTINDGDFYTQSNDNYLAIIKSGTHPFNLEFTDGQGFDVFVFETKGFELVYSDKIVLSSDSKNGGSGRISLREDGSVYVKAKMYDDENSTLKHGYNTPNQIKVVNLTKDQKEENVIELNETSIFSSLESNLNDVLINLTIGEDKSSLRIRTTLDPFNNSSSSDEKTISLPEILNKENASFSKRFIQTLKDEEDIYVLATNRYSHTTSNNEIITAVSLAFRPTKGLGLTNLLFCTIVYRVDSEGVIEWYNVIPLAEFLTSVLDKEDNLHLYANGISEEYNAEGNYVGNNKTEVNANFSPIEVIINQSTGDCESNKVLTDGFVDNQGFASTQVAFRFNENCSLVGKNDQNRISSVSSSSNNGITFGIVKF